MTDTNDNSCWSKNEFADVDLGDERLNLRLIKLAGQFTDQPQAPINQACDDWADTKAAYRFFDNESVTSADILKPHQMRIQQRMKGLSVVLAVQDTSTLNYTHHPRTSGLGPIASSKQTLKGLMMHTTLALSVGGLPLGVLTQQIWARPQKAKGRSYKRKQQPITEKESFKWLKALAQSVELKPAGSMLVTVCDREADLYEFLHYARKLETHYLVRAAQDRGLTSEGGLLWRSLMTCRVAGEIKVALAARKNESAREATVEVRFSKVSLRPPFRPKAIEMEPLPPLEVYAVLVKEVEAPTGIEPIEWMLLTNVEVINFEQACERVQWYCCRWQIETYHKVLKSGCRVEESRLASAERLKRYVALMSVIAWRLFWMSNMNRNDPQAACTTVLTEEEWQALYCTIHKRKELPKQLPTVYEVVRWIGKLGGFLARKGDKEPGVTVIWRGWQRLTDIVATWQLMRSDQFVGNR